MELILSISSLRSSGSNERSILLCISTILMIDGPSKSSMTNIKNLEIEKENQGIFFLNCEGKTL